MPLERPQPREHGAGRALRAAATAIGTRTGARSGSPGEVDAGPENGRSFRPGTRVVETRPAAEGAQVLEDPHVSLGRIAAQPRNGDASP